METKAFARALEMLVQTEDEVMGAANFDIMMRCTYPRRLPGDKWEKDPAFTQALTIWLDNASTALIAYVFCAYASSLPVSVMFDLISCLRGHPSMLYRLFLFVLFSPSGRGVPLGRREEVAQFILSHKRTADLFAAVGVSTTQFDRADSGMLVPLLYVVTSSTFIQPGFPSPRNDWRWEAWIIPILYLLNGSKSIRAKANAFFAKALRERSDSIDVQNTVVLINDPDILAVLAEDFRDSRPDLADLCRAAFNRLDRRP